MPELYIREEQTNKQTRVSCEVEDVSNSTIGKRAYAGGIMHITSGLYSTLFVYIWLKKNIWSGTCRHLLDTNKRACTMNNEQTDGHGHGQTGHEQNVCLHAETKHHFKSKRKQLAEHRWQHT